MLENKIILLTGGTGSFGQKFTEIALTHNPKTIRIYSRGELLQQEMSVKFNEYSNIRFFVGDIRDKDRLSRAMTGVDIVIHAAALKQVPACEYNPIEAVKTNIDGAINIIDCAINNKVEKVIGISSDKAVHPVNLYGMTKAVMEKLFIQGNVYAKKQTKFSCVRYGNVVGSRGSVIPIFQEQAKTGKITITHLDMTRFWITLEQGVNFAINCLSAMKGGEIFVPKIPSMKLIDLADAIAPNCDRVISGIRPGEKIHETLISEDEARRTREYEDCFIIQPEFPFWTENTFEDTTGKKILTRYSSDNNSQWLTKKQLEKIVEGVKE